jgi:hypothetical protein
MIYQREKMMYLTIKCHHIDESKKGEEGGLGIDYIQ